MGLGKVWRPEEGEAVWEGGQVERWCEEDSRLQGMGGLVGAPEIPTVLGRVPEFRVESPLVAVLFFVWSPYLELLRACLCTLGQFLGVVGACMVPGMELGPTACEANTLTPVLCLSNPEEKSATGQFGGWYRCACTYAWCVGGGQAVSPPPPSSQLPGALAWPFPGCLASSPVSHLPLQRQDTPSHPDSQANAAPLDLCLGSREGAGKLPFP